MAIEGVSFVSSLLLISRTRKPVGTTNKHHVKELNQAETSGELRITWQHHYRSHVGELVVIEEELLESLELTQFVRKLRKHVPAEVKLLKVLELRDLRWKPREPVAFEIEFLKLS